MRAGYKVYIIQEGKSIRGKGEKFWLNDIEIPSAQHDPLVFEGIISDGIWKVHYELYGVKRKSYGEFILKIENMEGTFEGSGANAKGKVIALKNR